MTQDNAGSGSWLAATVQIVCCLGLVIFVCSHFASLFFGPKWKETHTFVRLWVSTDNAHIWHHLCTWSWLELGLPGWHQDHPGACTSSPLWGRWRRGGWEWVTGQRSDTLRGSASDARASSPVALLPETTSSVTAAFTRPHTTRFLCVTYPTYPLCHSPPLPPQKSIKKLYSGGISLFGWYHPPCCAVDTCVFSLDDKDNNLQLDQLRLNKVLILFRMTLTVFGKWSTRFVSHLFSFNSSHINSITLCKLNVTVA